MTPAQFIKNLDDTLRDIDKFARKDAPRIAGKIAVDHFKKNFQEGTEGFVNDGLKKWSEVNRRTGGKIDKKGRYVQNKAKGADRTRPILTGRTGALARSLEKPEIADNQVTISSNLPYAEAHNDGTTTAGRNKNVVIPQRQFMGESKELNELIINEINRKLNTILK